MRNNGQRQLREAAPMEIHPATRQPAELPSPGRTAETGKGAPRPVFLRPVLLTWILRALILVGILGLWQMATTNGVSELILPSPMSVMKALWGGFADNDATFLHHSGVTLLEAGLGFCLGFVLGLALGAIFAFVPLLRDALYPYIMAMQTFPKIAIAPLLLVWVGYGISSKIIIATMLAFFPIMVNTVSGLTSVPKDELDLFASFRASKWQEFWQLRWPRCLGYLFPALETAMILSLLGAIAGEFVGASAGLGYLLLQKTYVGDIASMFAVLIILATLGITLTVLMAGLRRRVLFWQQK